MQYKTKPLQHQKELVEKAVHLRRIGIYDEPGSGKTKMALDIIQNKNGLDQVYVFAPSRLKQTWLNEMEKHYLGRYDIQFIGYELLSRSGEMPLWATENTLIVFDESHLVKNPKSNRGKKLVKFFSEYEPQVISMSGTPKTNGNQDLYMQGGMLDLPCGQMPMELFMTTYCEWRPSPYGRDEELWVTDKNTDLLMKQFNPISWFRRKEDMLDLPDKIYSTIYYEQDNKVIEAFKKFREESILLMEQMESRNDELLFAKKSIMNFIRLCSGYLTVEDEWGEKELKEIIPFKKNPKFQALLALLETFGENEKVIILTSFIYEAEQIAAVLKDLGYGVLLHAGSNRVEGIEKEFNEGSSRALVATIQSIDTGFTLTSAYRMVYYNNTYQSVHRLQSEDRIHRQGQKQKCLYYDVVAKGFADEKVMLKVKDKIDNARALFDLYEAITN